MLILKTICAYVERQVCGYSYIIFHATKTPKH
jgi:hypothetical protein